MSRATLNLAFAERIAAALVAGGVREVVLSPGSRNTPLVLALLARPELRAHSVLDERVAGFLGLGLARASGRPAALLCTSGSAGAHYYPAVLEAEATGTPLLAVTADRPPELHGCGAPQTLDQRSLFGAHAASAELGPPDDAAADVALERVVARLLARGGPSQLNVSFREPLWEAGLAAQARPLRSPRVYKGHARLGDAGGLAERLRETKGAILCGPNASPAYGSAQDADANGRFARAATRLAFTLGWPLLADPASGLRHGPHSGEVVAAYDAFLRDDDVASALRPDVVLRFGRIPTSRATQRWVARARRSLLVEPRGEWHDPTSGASELLMADPTLLCDDLLSHLSEDAPADAAWFDRWREVEHATRAALAEHTAEGLWEGALARTVSDALPPGALLHVASSMPIRDLDAFAPARAQPLRVLANRGLNGIDGTLATAWGEALAGSGPAAVLCGDLAFLHDSGALLAARGLGVRATVVVANNGGGGIFSFLPIAAHPSAFTPWFQTPQHADLGALCAAAGVSWQRTSDLCLLSEALRSPSDLRVFEVPVDREFNLARHRAAFDAAARAARTTLLEESCPSTGSR